MAGPQGIRIVVRELEAGQDEQPVQADGTRGLSLDLREVGVEPQRVHVIAGAGDVVRDREHVEAALTVEIAQPAHVKRAVAPRRVSVELAEKWTRLRRHLPRMFAANWPLPRPFTGSLRDLRRYVTK